MSDNRYREVVYLATVPESFEPERSWNQPTEATEIRLYAKKLTYEQAAGFVSTYNAGRIEARQQTGEPIGTWAIWSKWVKPRRLRYELRKRLQSKPQEATPVEALDPHGVRRFRIVVNNRTVLRSVSEAEARTFLEAFTRPGVTAEAFQVGRNPISVEGGAA